MCKLISSELIMGNIIIELVTKNQDNVTFDQIVKFERKLSSQVYKLDYYTAFDSQEIFSFIDNYSFFISICENMVKFNDSIISDRKKGINRLNRHFRYGIPKEIIKEITAVASKMW